MLDRHTDLPVMRRVAVKQSQNVALVVVHVHQADQVHHHHHHHQAVAQAVQALAVLPHQAVAHHLALRLITNHPGAGKEPVHQGKLLIKNEDHRIHESAIAAEKEILPRVVVQQVVDVRQSKK